MVAAGGESFGGDCDWRGGQLRCLTVGPTESTGERKMSLLRLVQVVAIFIPAGTDSGPPLEGPRAPRAYLVAPAARPSSPRNLFNKLAEVALDHLGVPDVLLDRVSKLSFAVGYPQPIQGLHVPERQLWRLESKRKQ